MVRSEKFTGLISVIVGTDLEAVIDFLRREGIDVSLSAKPKEVVRILILSIMSSKVFKDNFINWANSRYKNESNMNGYYNTSGFDPMATQGSGQEFDAMSSQQGANLKEDGFANASGFDPMSTQSGGFSTTETQYANLFGNRDKPKSYTPYDPATGTGGSKVGNFLRSDSIKSIFDVGLDWFKTDTANKQARDIARAGLDAEKVRLEQLKEQGKLTQQQFEAQLKMAELNANAPQSSVILWVIGGVVLLGALGTTIYFATRKK